MDRVLPFTGDEHALMKIQVDWQYILFSVSSSCFVSAHYTEARKQFMSIVSIALKNGLCDAPPGSSLREVFCRFIGLTVSNLGSALNNYDLPKSMNFGRQKFTQAEFGGKNEDGDWDEDEHWKESDAMSVCDLILGLMVGILGEMGLTVHPPLEVPTFDPHPFLDNDLDDALLNTDLDAHIFADITQGADNTVTCNNELFPHVADVLCPTPIEGRSGEPINDAEELMLMLAMCFFENGVLIGMEPCNGVSGALFNLLLRITGREYNRGNRGDRGYGVDALVRQMKKTQLGHSKLLVCPGRNEKIGNDVLKKVVIAASNASRDFRLSIANENAPAEEAPAGVEEADDENAPAEEAPAGVEEADDDVPAIAAPVDEFVPIPEENPQAEPRSRPSTSTTMARKGKRSKKDEEENDFDRSEESEDSDHENQEENDFDHAEESDDGDVSYGSDDSEFGDNY